MRKRLRLRAVAALAPRRSCTLLVACVLGAGAWAADGSARSDSLPALTSTPGDEMRGRALVVDRYKGLCLLCHAGPFPEQAMQGNLAPSLDDVGQRLTAGQLRLRIVDSRQLNPQTLMPSYFRTEGFEQAVGDAWIRLVDLVDQHHGSVFMTTTIGYRWCGGPG